MDWLADRMRERSTWAGLFTLLALVGHLHVPDGLAEAITAAGVAVGSLLSVVMKERER